MTLEQAQRIMGPKTEIHFFRKNDRLLAVAFQGSLVEGLGLSNKTVRPEALGKLVAAVLKERSHRVFVRQQWKCANCGKRRQLQAHHIKLRSQGRDDRESNLEGLCQKCHVNHHRNGGSARSSAASSPHSQNPTS